MEKVLVVEDQQVMLEFILRLLDDMPFLELAGHASNGVDAVNMAQEIKPSMAILDIMLPGLNGVDLCRKLRGTFPNIKVLVFSAFQNRSLIRSMIDMGANGMVQKSESLKIFEQALEAVAAGQTFYSPAISDELRDMMLHPNSSDDLSGLSPREREVLQLIASSYSNKEIASALNITLKTAETHRANIISKLNIHDAAGLTRYAIANGLVDLN